MIEHFEVLSSVIGATLRIATPLIFCAFAGIFSERAGVIDIGLEGKLLASAFAAASAGAVGFSAPMAVLVAIVVSISLSWVHGFACITHRGDQIVSGVAINLIAGGMTIVLGLVWFHLGGRTPPVNPEARFGVLFAQTNAEMKVGAPLEKFLSEAIFSQDLLVWFGLLLVPLSWWLLYRTRFGLRLRAAGENPSMVNAAGISVRWLRYRAVTISGFLCALGGAHLALSLNASFTQNMSAGRGFMALAAMVFGRWQPFTTLTACLLFGFLDAVAIRLQGVQLPVIGHVPVELIQALPYAMTVVLLAGFFGRAKAPMALGKPWTDR
jgi:general nucleoside transport system permease protein